MKKGILAAAIVIVIVFNMLEETYAGFQITSFASTMAFSQCQIYLGDVILEATWDYYDGDYVGIKREDNKNLINYYFWPDISAAANFTNLYYSGTSGYDSTVSIQYLTKINSIVDCLEFGKLSLTCDVWGETSESAVVYFRRCGH